MARGGDRWAAEILPFYFLVFGPQQLSSLLLRGLPVFLMFTFSVLFHFLGLFILIPLRLILFSVSERNSPAMQVDLLCEANHNSLFPVETKA